jgi:hypothetical protein
MENCIKKLLLLIGLACTTDNLGAMETKTARPESPQLGFSINALKSPSDLLLEACQADITGDLALAKKLLESPAITKREIETASKNCCNLELQKIFIMKLAAMQREARRQEEYARYRARIKRAWDSIGTVSVKS